MLLLSGFANAQVNQPTAKLEVLFKQTPLDQPELVWVRVGHLKRSAWLWLEDAVVVLIAKQRAHHDVSATLVRNLLTAIDCYEAEAELAAAARGCVQERKKKVAHFAATWCYCRRLRWHGHTASGLTGGAISIKRPPHPAAMPNAINTVE